MFKQLTVLIITLLLFTLSTAPVAAQTSTPPPGPVYVVQAGDTLWGIAQQFNVSVTDLQSLNNLPDTTILAGEHLVIPGLEGLTGTLITEPVPYGETLRSLTRQYRLDETLVRKLNHIVSPTELFAGYSLTLLQQDNQTSWTARATLAKGESMLELAVEKNTDPWTISQINTLAGTWDGLPGDVLYLPSGDSSVTPTGFPAVITAAQVDPFPIVQGTTVQVKVSTSQEVTLGGLLVDQPLRFFPAGDGSQVALQGIHAMTAPGLYPLRIDVVFPNGTQQSFEQMIMVTSGNFGYQTLQVDETTIDPAVTVPEDQWLLSVVSPATPQKYWQGIFQLPVDSQYSVSSGYGIRRSYNGGELNSFHTGLDFRVYSRAHPFDIYAPADGVVVFTGLKTVRGNATIIDHGWGVYSGLYHQAEIYVKVGDRVTAGQLIGKIGETGRVTGPHLHWDLWVNGIQVNPLQWLDQQFPH